MILTSLTIAGAERKSLLVPQTLRIEAVLNGRDVAQFSLRDSGANRPTVGQVVQIEIDGTLRFAGTIDRIRERNLTPRTTTTVQYDIEAVDWNQLADRQLHADLYEGLTMKAIVQDLVAENLADDGVQFQPSITVTHTGGAVETRNVASLPLWWDTYAQGSASAYSSDAYSGSLALLVSSASTLGGGGNYGGTVTSAFPALTVGQTYTLSFWARSLTGTGSWAISNQSGAGDGSSLSFSFAPTGTWQQFSKTAVLDAVKPQLYFWSHNPSHQILIDRLEIYQSGNPEPILRYDVEASNWIVVDAAWGTIPAAGETWSFYGGSSTGAVRAGSVSQAVMVDRMLTLFPTDAFPTGPTIDTFVANYQRVSDLFDRLSELTGYMWDIGPDKVLRFLDRSTMTAPVALTQTSGADLAYSLDIESTREQYRNVQFVRGGLTETDTQQIEQFAGDGKQRTFVVALPISRVPVVKVNNVVKTVGIRQVDTGKDWYWAENSNEISQDQSGTVLTASDTLRVEYYGYFPLLTIHREDVRVTERQTVEGGSGIYEQMESDEDITDAQLARDRAAGLLRRFGVIETTLRFRSRVTGWEPGQLLSVSRPEHGLSGDFLITRVDLSHEVKDEYRYTVTAVSGEAVESWVAFFKRIADARLLSRRSQNEVKSQVIALIRTASESVAVAESVTTGTNTAAATLWEVGDPIGVSEVAP